MSPSSSQAYINTSPVKTRAPVLLHCTDSWKSLGHSGHAIRAPWLTRQSSIYESDPDSSVLDLAQGSVIKRVFTS